MSSDRCIMCFSNKAFVYRCMCTGYICHSCKLISPLVSFCSINCIQYPILGADDHIVKLRLSYIDIQNSLFTNKSCYYYLIKDQQKRLNLIACQRKKTNIWARQFLLKHVIKDIANIISEYSIAST